MNRRTFNALALAATVAPSIVASDPPRFRRIKFFGWREEVKDESGRVLDFVWHNGLAPKGKLQDCIGWSGSLTDKELAERCAFSDGSYWEVDTLE